ncbi:hypothetical protein HY625_00430 [Candidatus Uhrbacteria bacterium]|nr:hypothetical protein [Candidatus Uhrbacteria bacterium]
MKSLASAITIAFLFATLFLSFTLAACGTSDTPICSSIFGMNSKACATNPLEHHIAITEQPTLCTLDALGNAVALFLIVMLVITVATPLLSRVVRITSAINENVSRIFRVMNPFDPLRFAFIEGRVQQKRDVRVA